MSNNNQIEQQREVVRYTVGDDEIKLTPKIVQDYLADGKAITLPEFKMFTSLCKARGLNPFLKEAYIIKYGNAPAQIVVGKDAILKRAILNNKFDGREQGVIVVDAGGNVIHKEGTFILTDETLVGGWAKVYRKDWAHPVHITVSLSEVEQRKNDGTLNKNWKTKAATMVEKVALVRALREAFVEDVGGMYEADEISDVPDIEVVDQHDDGKEEIIEQIEDAVVSDENIVDINDI